MLHTLLFVLLWATATSPSFFKREDPEFPSIYYGDQAFWDDLFDPSEPLIHGKHSAVPKQKLPFELLKEMELLLQGPLHTRRSTEVVEESKLPSKKDSEQFSPEKHLYCDPNSSSFESLMISPYERVHIYSANYPRNYSVNTRCGVKIWGQHSHRPLVTCPDVSVGPGDSLAQIEMVADHLKITSGQEEIKAFAPKHGINIFHFSDDKHTAKGFHCVISLADSIG